jgi:transcriptional regulator with XRE-family HTH domain
MEAKNIDKKKITAWMESKRGSMGKSKKDFSDFLGITPQVYQHILSGRTYPSIDVIGKMAAVFDVREIFGGK